MSISSCSPPESVISTCSGRIPNTTSRPGAAVNTARGMGTIWSPICTQQLEAGHAITGKPSFMISLSKQGDSLSQWRAYRERSGGICLRLPSDLIQTAAAEQAWLLAPCIYDENEVETMVRELFEWHLTKCRETDKRIGMVSPGGLSMFYR